MTDNKLEATTSADFEIKGSNEEAPLQGEEDCAAEPEERSENIDSEESDDEVFDDRLDPWTVTLQGCANLREYRKVVKDYSFALCASID